MVDEDITIEKGLCNIRTIFEDEEVSVTHVISQNDNINSDMTYVITIDNDDANVKVITGYGTVTDEGADASIILEEYNINIEYNTVTIELPVGEYNILSTPSSLDYTVKSLTVTIVNEEYVDNNQIIRVPNDIEIVLSKCGEVLLTKSCKYFLHEPYMTPNNYDLYFNYAEIPVNVIVESPSDLKKRLQRTLPLTKILHLNLETKNAPKSNNLHLTSHVKLKYYNSDNVTNGNYISIEGTWNTRVLESMLEDTVDEWYTAWVDKYLIGDGDTDEGDGKVVGLSTAISASVNVEYYTERMSDTTDNIIDTVKENIYQLVLNKSNELNMEWESYDDNEEYNTIIENFRTRIRENLNEIISLFLYGMSLTPEQYEGNSSMIGFDEWFIKSTNIFIDNIISFSVNDFIDDVPVYLYQNGTCLNPILEDIVNIDEWFDVTLTLTDEEYGLLESKYDEGAFVQFEVIGGDPNNVVDNLTCDTDRQTDKLVDCVLYYNDFEENEDSSYSISFKVKSSVPSQYIILPSIISYELNQRITGFRFTVVSDTTIIDEDVDETVYDESIVGDLVLTSENNWRVTTSNILPFYEEDENGNMDFDKVISYRAESTNSLCTVRIVPMDKSYLNPVTWELL